MEAKTIIYKQIDGHSYALIRLTSGKHLYRMRSSRGNDFTQLDAGTHQFRSLEDFIRHFNH